MGRACKKLIRGLEEKAERSSSWFWHHPDLCWMSGPSSGRLENVIARQGKNILRWLETFGDLKQAQEAEHIYRDWHT